MHVFLLKMIGKGDVLEKKETTTISVPIEEDPRLSFKDTSQANGTLWIPEALTIPPETTTEEITTLPPTTTTEAPFMWAMKVPFQHENGTYGIRYQPMENSYQDALQRFGMSMPDYIAKIPITTTENPKGNGTENATKAESTTANTTELPMATNRTYSVKELLDELVQQNHKDAIKEDSDEDY